MVDQFNESIDLLILVVFGPDNFEIGSENTQIHQSRNILALCQDVFLFPVMALHLTGQGNRSSGVTLVAAVPLHGVLDGLLVRYHQYLAVAAFQFVDDDLH